MFNLLIEIKNRLLQALAQFAPGARTLRVTLHRWRGVRLGRDVFIGTAVIVETAHPDRVSIGDRSALSVRTIVLAHNRGSPLPADGSPTVQIESDVYVGAGAIILPGVTIGSGAVIAAGSVVTKSVPSQTLVQGNPARPVARCKTPLTQGYEAFRTGLYRLPRHSRP